MRNFLITAFDGEKALSALQCLESAGIFDSITEVISRSPDYITILASARKSTEHGEALLEQRLSQLHEDRTIRSVTEINLAPDQSDSSILAVAPVREKRRAGNASLVHVDYSLESDLWPSENDD